MDWDIGSSSNFPRNLTRKPCIRTVQKEADWLTRCYQTTVHQTLLASFFTSIVATAHGVVIAGADGTQNTTAPADDFGFGNVGRVDSGGFVGSCVYLGSGWVLTAYHLVNDPAGGFRLGTVILRETAGADVSFTPDSNSATQLTNGDGSFTDLALFRLTETPSFLSGLVISAMAPPAGSSVILAGNGFNRSPSLTHWDVNTSTTPDTWTEVSPPPPPDRSGYHLATGQTLRWGTNTLEPGTTEVNNGFGTVRSIKTDFDNISGEAQGVVGDSGGGLFFHSNSGWELAGIIHSINLFDGQPVGTAVFGNTTFAADLSSYREQIQLIAVPEPSLPALLLIGLNCTIGCRRRARPKVS